VVARTATHMEHPPTATASSAHRVDARGIDRRPAPTQLATADQCSVRIYLASCIVLNLTVEAAVPTGDIKHL
jgi:hypothetical protein